MRAATEEQRRTGRRGRDDDELRGGEGPVVTAVRRDLARLPDDLALSALAASALALAGEIDGDNSATSKSMCAGQLQSALRELRELAPAEEVKDGVDEIADRRARRRSGGAATKG